MSFIKVLNSYLPYACSVALFSVIPSLAMAQTIEELLGKIQPENSFYSLSQPANRGQLQPINRTILSAGIDAKIASFPVRTGDRVKKGDVLAEFDCAIERANNKIEMAENDLAQQNFTINQRLFNLKNISELELKVSESETFVAQGELDRTSSLLSECVVRAPFSGIVTEKYVESFQYVNRGEALVQLIDTDNLEVEMVLPSVDVTLYQKDTVFSLSLDETGTDIKARVDRVVNVIDPVSQTIKVIGKLVEKPVNLMPGMSGIVSFVLDEEE